MKIINKKETIFVNKNGVLMFFLPIVLRNKFFSNRNFVLMAVPGLIYRAVAVLDMPTRWGDRVIKSQAILSNCTITNPNITFTAAQVTALGNKINPFLAAEAALSTGGSVGTRNTAYSNMIQHLNTPFKSLIQVAADASPDSGVAS